MSEAAKVATCPYCRNGNMRRLMKPRPTDPAVVRAEDTCDNCGWVELPNPEPKADWDKKK